MAILQALQQRSRGDQKTARALRLAGAACLGNLLLGLGKLTMGLLSLSVFTCVGACYTFGMVAAKSLALAGILQAENTRQQYRYYKRAGLVLLAASALYMLYAIRLFVNPETIVYDMNVALGIATFTFTELVVNLHGVRRERHNPSPLMHAIKMINLSASLICLVLTQAAILSFADANTAQHPAANGFMGILMGGAASLLAGLMLHRLSQMQRGRYCGPAFHRLKALMRKEKLRLHMKPLSYHDSDGQAATLRVNLEEADSCAAFLTLRRRAAADLNLILLLAEQAETEDVL